MAISEAFSGSAAIGATEFSCPNNSTTLTPQTDDGVYQFFLDVSDMIAGDELQILIYEKCRAADSQRIVYESVIAGAQGSPIWVSPSLMLLHGWDVTLKAIAGGVTVNWSIRKVS